MGVTTTRRTRAAALAAAAAVILLAAVAALLTTPGPDTSPSATEETTGPGPLTVTDAGDLDGDDSVSTEEREQAAETEAAATNAVAALAPRAGKDVGDLLVTPAGDKWWDLVTSIYPEGELWETGPPADARWYAVTDGASYRSMEQVKGRTLSYRAIHVAFGTAEQAFAWASQAPVGKAVSFLYRGNVVTVVPGWVDLKQEPFPDQLVKLRDLEPEVGFWSIDFAKTTDLDAENAIVKSAYRGFWHHLGFEKARWSAVTRDPGRWVGALTGWDADAVDIGTAVGALVATADEQSGATGMSAMAMHMVAEAAGSEVRGGLGDYDVHLPEHTDLDLSIDPSWLGAANGTYANPKPPVTLMTYWVIDDVLTISPTFDRAVSPEPELASSGPDPEGASKGVRPPKPDAQPGGITGPGTKPMDPEKFAEAAEDGLKGHPGKSATPELTQAQIDALFGKDTKTTP